MLSSSMSQLGGRLRSTSVLAVCGRRRATQQRRISLAYILDLLAFAVETGRLTEACADVVRQLVHRSGDEDDLQVAATPPTAAGDSVEEQLTSPDQRRTDVITLDEETVAREVRFRKLYNEAGVRGVACGLTPFDRQHELRDSVSALGRSSRFSREFPRPDCLAEDEVFGNALEDLLLNLEVARGTLPELIPAAVRAKRELVRQLFNSRPVSRPDMYRRLVRALDQRAPPDQRLFRQPSLRQVHKSSTKIGSSIPSCWSKRASAGSQLFAHPTKLSDFMTTQ